MAKFDLVIRGGTVVTAWPDVARFKLLLPSVTSKAGSRAWIVKRWQAFAMMSSTNARGKHKRPSSLSKQPAARCRIEHLGQRVVAAVIPLFP